jgi:peptide/nickel transport system permease protein
VTALALAVVGLVTLAAVAAPWLAPYSPTEMDADLLTGPSARHLLGTDDLGRYILSRIVHGPRSRSWSASSRWGRPPPWACRWA